MLLLVIFSRTCYVLFDYYFKMAVQQFYFKFLDAIFFAGKKVEKT